MMTRLPLGPDALNAGIVERDELDGFRVETGYALDHRQLARRVEVPLAVHCGVCNIVLDQRKVDAMVFSKLTVGHRSL
jgi:hypothetical protein